MPCGLYNIEDAIRQAVSLGADADTLGAIVGSIAEALWGIPEWMKEKALSYLPKDMRAVVTEFHTRLNRLRKLTKKCQFYYVGDFKSVDEKDKDACAIEREWAHDLARSYTNADKIKHEMAKRFPMEVWQDIADDYDLPVSLVGYIAKHILTSRHKTPNALVKFLKEHYYMRMEQAAKKKEEKEQKQQFMAIMHWKLGLGHALEIGTWGLQQTPVWGKPLARQDKDCNRKRLADRANARRSAGSYQHVL